MKIARVFPIKTNGSPTDEMAFFGPPPFFAEADEVHISVAFTWDIPHAEWLAKQWEQVAPIKIGGPAYNKPGDLFQPGMYLKKGYVITSRGCPNKCWFCSVWKREPRLKELPIVEGWNVLDDNLLACSEKHIKSVFDMLKRQKECVQFTGGIEAKRLKGWHVDLFDSLKPKQIFFAYDTPDDYESLERAGIMMKRAGFNRQILRCYVLIGYPKDTFELAEKRLRQVLKLGMYPMAMLYRNFNGNKNVDWMKFQRVWVRPAIISAKAKELETHQEII